MMLLFALLLDQVSNEASWFQRCCMPSMYLWLHIYQLLAAAEAMHVLSLLLPLVSPRAGGGTLLRLKLPNALKVQQALFVQHCRQ
jgi:hypothetical protein